MNERVKGFSLKRTSNVPDDSFTYGTVYPVYRCTTAHPIYKFYILDDTCSKQYFNALNGHIDRESWLHPDNWKIIRHNKDEKEMNEKVFKAGDKIRFKNNWGDVTAGKEYELIKVDDFLMFIDDVGDQLYFYDLEEKIRVRLSPYCDLMDDEQTMTKDFTGLKVGDKITCDSNNTIYWIKGKEYEVLENKTDIYRDCPFYIMDEYGDRRWFGVDEKGKLTYPGLNDIFSWNKPEVERKVATMTKDFTGLKVGDKITAGKTQYNWWVKGKEYEVYANNMDTYNYCNFYIIREKGTRCSFSVNANGELTHADLNDIFYWNKPGVGDEQKTDQVNNIKLSFVKADIKELLDAIEKDEQDKYYIYDSKKGTMKPAVWETNLHQLLNCLILRKEGK